MVTTTMEEYEQFGEVRLATRITSNVTGMQQVITLSEVRFDGIEAAMFEPPAVIRRMIDANP